MKLVSFRSGGLVAGLTWVVLMWLVYPAAALLSDDEPSQQPPAAESPSEDEPLDSPSEPAEPQGEPKEEPQDQPSGKAKPAEKPTPEQPESPTEEMDKPSEEKSDPSTDQGEDEGESDDESKEDDEQPADKLKELPESISFSEFVLLPRAGTYGRAAFHTDPVEAAIAKGEWKTPKGGESVTTPDGRTLKWRSGKADADGEVSTQSIAGGGYAVATVESPAAGVMLLQATGHAAVYVNGQLRAGDVYRLGGLDLPVELNAGANELVFHVYQPELHAKLVKPTVPVDLLADRATLPTLVNGRDRKVWIGLPILNASSEPLTKSTLVAHTLDADPVEIELPWIDSASLYNASFEVAIPQHLSDDTLAVEVSLVQGDQTLATERLDLRVVDPHQVQTRTFRSRIDRSVQSYAVRPAGGSQSASDLVRGEEPPTQPQGAIVALHGLGSTSEEFIEHFAPRDWAHIVAPSGRGRYGFDWQDWSRTDALEALDDAAKHFDIDPQRVYLTGHAAGGHGAMVLGVSQPQRFAAIATSGAWASLWTYGGGMPSFADPTPPQAMLLQCATPSNTPLLLGNLRGTGVYLQHGSDDPQVPLSEARHLLAGLAESHDDFRFREKLDAGSWWGDETLDHSQIKRFFRTRKRATSSPDHIEFATADVGSFATAHWITIGTQQEPFALSKVQAERQDSPRRIDIRTTNVERLRISKEAVPARTPFQVRIDGSRPVAFRGMPASGEIWFERSEAGWQRVLSPNKKEKGPHRNGGFKSLFQNDPVLVYGTKGNAEENEWARMKARFDAESFYYRGSGSLEVVPDTQYRAGDYRDRNVILYGNAETNLAWPALLSQSQVQVRKDQVQVDSRPEIDPQLGVLMVQPHPQSTKALVGVVGGTGVEGMRLTSRLRYFLAGVNYPDLVIIGPDALTEGDSDVRAAGFFATDWDVQDGNIVWRDLAL